MTATTTTSTEHVQRNGLWFGMIGAPLAWLCHVITSLFISWQACQDGDPNWGALSQPAVRWLLIGWTAAMLLVAILAGVTSFRLRRRLGEAHHISDAEGREREEFMTLLGTLASVVFTVAILWASVPPLLIDICMRAK
ncbi:MAG: hypothetical protein KY432_08475 [Acidobacteria bacterium]|nr:hypothetical protein [Acidobacteriota bacterium]